MPCHPSATIAPTARIHPDSQIGPGCHIGEFVVIEQDVVLGEACKIEPYVFIKRWTTLGDRNEISAGTVLGSDPLDKNFKGERSYLTLGHDNKVREHFTISRGTKPEATTVIGNGNYIMTSGHIAHDCVIGDHNVICSSALIAGYVTIEDRAFISGGVVVHQYSKIGRLVMVGGNSRVNLDLPPYFLYSEFNAVPVGLNIVGLRRAGISREEISNLKTAYRLLYRAGLKLESACAAILEQVPSDATRHLVNFIQASNRGITRE
ncbi:MAG: acyl-ACP--UDP-N-acetylglucosamine O-acyltransferase [Acidobacteria bacterium]|nr:acyl-ACP--UDP-N-acetylglucosamine O-acyltransferase [Acidobacteriota bacterium]